MSHLPFFTQLLASHHSQISNVNIHLIMHHSSLSGTLSFLTPNFSLYPFSKWHSDYSFSLSTCPPRAFPSHYSPLVSTCSGSSNCSGGQKSQAYTYNQDPKYLNDALYRHSKHNRNCAYSRDSKKKCLSRI